MRATLIVNASSGHGAARRVAGSVARELRRTVDSLRVTAPPDAPSTTLAARDAVQRGDDLVAVVGGDGTVHLVVQELAGSPTALVAVPGGSGNDFAAALGVPPEPVAAARHVADLVAAGRQRLLDLGRVVDGEYFTTVLCTGFDAGVTVRAGSMRWPSGPRRYEMAVLAEVLTLHPRPVRVCIDDAEFEMDATLVAVANTGWYGGGLQVCPPARPDDGLLHVTLISATTRRRLLTLFPRFKAGTHLDLPEVSVMSGKRIRIEGSDTPVAADGEPQGQLPLTAECVPGALRVVA